MRFYRRFLYRFLLTLACALCAPLLAQAGEGALFTLSSQPAIAFTDATPAPDIPDAPGAPASLSPVMADSGFTLEIIRAQDAPAPDAQAARVLIYHTHTYEAYTATQDAPYTPTEKWRTADSTRNVAAVGARLAELLKSAGLSVTHDTTAFEPPALASAYERSLAMLEKRVANGERYDLYIDLHRDAYSQNNGENTVTLSGEEAARLMFLIGKGTGQTAAGYDQRPDWEANLALAQRLTDALNLQAPGLCRSVAVKSGRYNQHVAARCVLIEVGNNRNTLAQALHAMPALANAICEVLE